MDGIHPRQCGVWNGGGCCCCRSAQPQRVWPGLHSTSSVRGEYCSHVAYCCLPDAAVWWCVVCVLFVWWGILCPPSPRRGGGWGHCGWWGVCGGGWRSDGRAVVLPASPSVCWRPPCLLWWWLPLKSGGGSVTDSPLNVGVPLCCLLGGCVEWRGGGVL